MLEPRTLAKPCLATKHVSFPTIIPSNKLAQVLTLIISLKLKKKIQNIHSYQRHTHIHIIIIILEDRAFLLSPLQVCYP